MSKDPSRNRNGELAGFLTVFPDVWTGTGRESRRGSGHKSYDWPLRELGSFTGQYLVSSGLSLEIFLGRNWPDLISSGQKLAGH